MVTMFVKISHTITAMECAEQVILSKDYYYSASYITGIAKEYGLDIFTNAVIVFIDVAVGWNANYFEA